MGQGNLFQTMQNNQNNQINRLKQNYKRGGSNLEQQAFQNPQRRIKTQEGGGRIKIANQHKTIMVSPNKKLSIGQ